MSQIYNGNTKRPKPKENHLRILAIPYREFKHFAGNSSKGLGSRRERCQSQVSIFENIPKKLPHLSPKSYRNFTQWFRERHSWSIVVTQLRSVSRLHVNTSSRRILKETTEETTPFGTTRQELSHLGKGVKPDRVIQLRSEEVRTHASYKATRTWENFNRRGTKMIPFSDEL